MPIAGRSADSTVRIIKVTGEPVTYDEDPAAEVLIPGILLAFNGSGALIKNTTTAKIVPKRVALERDELGKDIDQAYAIGDQVKVGAFKAGTRALLWLASGQNVAKGALLGPAGSGQVTANATAGQSIGFACQSCNNTNGNAAGFQTTGAVTTGDVRLLVEFI